MDPRSSHDGGSSPKRSRPLSAHGDVVLEPPAPAVAVESRRPDEIPSSQQRSLAIWRPQVPSAGGSSSSAGRNLQTASVEDNSFVLIKDVNAMLQTGRFEGQKIAYMDKRRKLGLLNGEIHGTSYFCSCGDSCDNNGKALSANAFAQHAVKTGKGIHNPNDHIILTSLNMSLFEACKKLKQATNDAIFETTFEAIMKNDQAAVPKQNVEPLVQAVRNLEKRMEKTEKQVYTMEKSIDLLRQELVRHKDLFQDVSKVMRNFVDNN